MDFTLSIIILMVFVLPRLFQCAAASVPGPSARASIESMLEFTSIWSFKLNDQDDTASPKTTKPVRTRCSRMHWRLPQQLFILLRIFNVYCFVKIYFEAITQSYLGNNKSNISIKGVRCTETHRWFSPDSAVLCRPLPCSSTENCSIC